MLLELNFQIKNFKINISAIWLTPNGSLCVSAHSIYLWFWRNFKDKEMAAFWIIKVGISKWRKKQIRYIVCAFGSLCSPTFINRKLSPKMYIHSKNQVFLFEHFINTSSDTLDTHVPSVYVQMYKHVLCFNKNTRVLKKKTASAFCYS